MARRTKKVGIAGKYRAQYGVRVRKRMAVVEAAKSANYSCPRCLMQSVTRTDTGIWKCRRCDLVFAGGAYVPVTTAGITREKAVREDGEQAGGKSEEEE